MGLSPHEQAVQDAQDQILGYLNFSSGNHDTNFFKNLSLLYDAVSGKSIEAEPEGPSAPTEEGEAAPLTISQVKRQLETRMEELSQTSDAFRDMTQAQSVLDLTVDRLLPAYRDYHRDLLFHQSNEFLFSPFFMGRAFEAVLQQGAPWDRSEEIIAAALSRLNDFIGHRPVAALESQKIEPYDHEWVRAVPVYVRGAGVASGRYQGLVHGAIEILKTTNPHLLRAAQFDLQRLEELAIDPRAFDFDHPVNQRPNHHFGQWDEHWIDGDGFYRRFILHQVILDSLLQRVDEVMADPEQAIAREELMREASAVLACTILMASGISGSGPGAYDSNTTLSTLLPLIAEYRDQFYDEYLQTVPIDHRKRLEQEAKTRGQPLGAARQDINSKLSQRRASQLVNCRLASIFARMGYPEAAENQAKIVPVASARINCRIDCLLSAADQAMSRGDFDEAFATIPQIMEWLKRGIHCGAIVDPWNILGFHANYELFPGIQDTAGDHRVFELVDLMDRIFATCSRLWSEAAASDCLEMCSTIRKEFLSIVHWWRQFAAHEVTAVDAVDALEIFEAAELVAEALNLWHKGGAAAGDIGFWAQHAELFDSPKAYTLVIDALMQRGDYKTSMALLVHWLSQSDDIPLQLGDSSFYDLVFHWISEQKNRLRCPSPHHEEKAEAPATGQSLLAPAQGTEDAPAIGTVEGLLSSNQVCEQIWKFYDFIDANAGQYQVVPEFQFNPSSPSQRSIPEDSLPFDEEDDHDSDLFRAAYDDVIYNDTTDDGFDGDVFDGSLTSDDAIEAEVERVLDRLEFLSTIASYWATAAMIPLPIVERSERTATIDSQLQRRKETLEAWIKKALDNRKKLLHLLDSINQFPLPVGGSDHDAMLHYDQLRLYKDTLLDQTIRTCIDTENAVRKLTAITRAIDYLMDDRSMTVGQGVSAAPSGQAPRDSRDSLTNVFAAILLNKPDEVLRNFDALKSYLTNQPILYVPISRGGNPEAIVKARMLQIAILDLMKHLPGLGLIRETYDLTEAALWMERDNPIGQGAVTEFDEIFEAAFTSTVHALIQSTQQFENEKRSEGASSKQEIARQSDQLLFECINKLTESMLILWLDHSQTLRLSVLEKVQKKASWERLVDFIKQYGGGLFTQHFLHQGNMRAILHQGVDHWLTQLEQAPERIDLRLLDELDRAIPRQRAVRYLTLVLESVLENHSEYRDYNTTTTQSDRGELLYTFLDFLRLRGRYDRICWHLKPVTWAHRILVNEQCTRVAKMWRRSLTEKVNVEADRYLTVLERLRNKYSMRMESIGRRLEGRFGHQMQIDRLRALVEPAMADPTSRESARAFELLRHEAQTFSRSTIGVGIDLPAWLAALEKEVEKARLPARLKEARFTEPMPHVKPLPIEQLRQQLDQLPRQEGMF